MVKNESSRIQKTLLSVKDIIDGLIVLDTGCTDNTISLCREIIPNTLVYTTDFVDYATTRNFLLDKCLNQSKFLLLLDANDEVMHPEVIRNYLQNTDSDMFYHRFEIITSNKQRYTYSRACIIRNISEIRYKYPVHETLMPYGKANEGLMNTSFYFFQDRSQDDTVTRKRRDVEILEKYVSENDDIRMMYYLCQTYANLHEYGKLYFAALHLSKFSFDGYHDAIYYSYLYIGLALYHTQKRMFTPYFLKAYEYSVDNKIPRCESLVLLSQCLFERNMLSDAKKYIDIACGISEPKNGNITLMKHLYDQRWGLKKRIESMI